MLQSLLEAPHGVAFTPSCFTVSHRGRSVAGRSPSYCTTGYCRLGLSGQAEGCPGTTGTVITTRPRAGHTHTHVTSHVTEPNSANARVHRGHHPLAVPSHLQPELALQCFHKEYPQGPCPLPRRACRWGALTPHLLHNSHPRHPLPTIGGLGPGLAQTRCSRGCWALLDWPVCWFPPGRPLRCPGACCWCLCTAGTPQRHAVRERSVQSIQSWRHTLEVCLWSESLRGEPLLDPPIGALLDHGKHGCPTQGPPLAGLFELA